MKLCIALDLKHREENLSLAKLVRDNFDTRDIILKVGLRSFIRDGKEFLRDLKTMGFSIFLDLKVYDIPNTMNDVLIECNKLDIDILTIHASCGISAMGLLSKLIKELDSKIKVIAVSALTSFTQEEFNSIYNSSISSSVEGFARDVSVSGLHGLVCSSHEIEIIKNISKDLLTIVPGIRSDSKNMQDSTRDFMQDQKRIGSVESVKSLGGDIIVVGRPIYQSEDRVGVIRYILEQIAQ